MKHADALSLFQPDYSNLDEQGRPLPPQRRRHRRPEGPSTATGSRPRPSAVYGDPQYDSFLRTQQAERRESLSVQDPAVMDYMAVGRFPRSEPRVRPAPQVSTDRSMMLGSPGGNSLAADSPDYSGDGSEVDVASGHETFTPPPPIYPMKDFYMEASFPYTALVQPPFRYEDCQSIGWFGRYQEGLDFLCLEVTAC